MGTCGQMWACSQIKNFKVTAKTAVAVNDSSVAGESTLLFCDNYGPGEHTFVIAF